MIINSLTMNGKVGFTRIDIADTKNLEKNGKYWIDLQDLGPEELEGFLDTFRIRGLARQICLESRDRPGFYPLKDEIVIVLPVLSEAEESKSKEYLLILCRENLMLTVHNRPIAKLDLISKLKGADSWLSEPSIGGVLSAMMIHISLEMLQKTVDFREDVLNAEEQMDKDPENIHAEDLISMRSELVSLGSLVSDQLPSVQALTTTEKAFIKLQESRDFLNCALANLQSVDASLTWMDQRLASLRAGFQMHAQDKMNRRLDALTILSAIFNPITLLAGIWGMNFARMPELNLPFAYPIALGVMGLIGTGMFFFFRKGGWFD